MKNTRFFARAVLGGSLALALPLHAVSPSVSASIAAAKPLPCSAILRMGDAGTCRGRWSLRNGAIAVEPAGWAAVCPAWRWRRTRAPRGHITGSPPAAWGTEQPAVPAVWPRVRQRSSFHRFRQRSDALPKFNRCNFLSLRAVGAPLMAGAEKSRTDLLSISVQGIRRAQHS